MNKGYIFLNDDLEMNKGRWHLWTRQPVTVGTMLNFGREARVSKVVSVNLLIIIITNVIIIIINNVISIIIAVTIAIIKIITIMAFWKILIQEYVIIMWDGKAKRCKFKSPKSTNCH